MPRPIFDESGNVTEAGLAKANLVARTLIRDLNAYFTNGSTPQIEIYSPSQQKAVNSINSADQVLRFKLGKHTDIVRNRLEGIGLKSYQEDGQKKLEDKTITIPAKSLAGCYAISFRSLFIGLQTHGKEPSRS